jgi:hypothetical protein
MFAARLAFQSPKVAGPPITNPVIGMTAISTAQTTTSEKKFGTASYIASNGSSYILNTSGAYNWWPSGTGDFTIQWWQYIPSGSNTSQHICSNEMTSSGGFGCRYGPQYGSGSINAINIFARGQADLDYWNITWTRNVWQFVSICRNTTAGSMYVHVDGVSLGAASGGSGAYARNFEATSGLNLIQIGNAGGAGVNGIYLDDFQVLAATALYTSASYSVPTSQAILQTGTTALFNMNGSNGGTSFPNVTSN